MEKKPIKIELQEWDYTCGDGCCYEWGTNVSVDGVKMPYKNDDTETILQQILEHLGYEPEIIRTFNE